MAELVYDVQNSGVQGSTNVSAVEPKTKRKKTPWEIATLVISIVLCVIMLPLLIINVVLIFKAVIHPNDLPSIFGYKPLIVMSDSMSPDIKTNDLIFSKVVDPSTLKEGDVITFHEKNGGIVTHKILAIVDTESGEKAFRTYGINNYQRNSDGTAVTNTNGDKIDVPDTELVSFSQVEGKYTSKMAGMGGFIYWMQSTWGLIICIGLPLVAFIVYELVRRNAELKANQATANNANAELDELRRKLAEMEKDKKD